LTLTDQEFRLFRNLIYEESGILIKETRKEFLEKRVLKRISETGASSPYWYYRYIASMKTDELLVLLDLMTINETSFFRNRPQIDFFNNSILPELIKKKETGGSKTLRIWSAGCSTGEEPYSIAMGICETIAYSPNWNIKIFASDISLASLKIAKDGEYSEDKVRATVDDHLIDKYFENNGNFFRIKDEIKNNNPLRNKHLYIYDTSDCLAGTIKKRPTVNFSDVILDDTLKSDIYDNTIFHLEKMVENNGIILFGKPGVGKSLVCSAIINEAINKGFSTCYLCSKVNFESLSELIREFLTPCILIYEDIDSLGQDRKETINTELSSFLQFINGLTEGNDRIVFIATTNYLEHLDDAIKNRPMRFNRKFEFKYPNNDQINKLITLYFDKKTSDKYSTTCYNKNFTGAHIKEIKRTATILSVKDNTDIDSVFEKSVKLVYDNFSITLRNKPGF